MHGFPNLCPVTMMKMIVSGLRKNRYLVCIYDLKRELHRYKIITTTCTKFAVLMDKIICTFGYNICSPLKLLFVKNW